MKNSLAIVVRIHISRGLFVLIITKFSNLLSQKNSPTAYCRMIFFKNIILWNSEMLLQKKCHPFAVFITYLRIQREQKKVHFRLQWHWTFFTVFPIQIFYVENFKNVCSIGERKMQRKQELFWLRFHSKFWIKVLIYLNIEEFHCDFFFVWNW